MNSKFFEQAVYINDKLLYGISGADLDERGFRERFSKVLNSEMVMIVDHLDIPEQDYINFFINKSNQDKNSYRLYKTKNGFRTIRTNKTENFNLARKKTSELIPDEDYFQFLYMYNNNDYFKARLTPKYTNVLKILYYQNYTHQEIDNILRTLNKKSFSLLVDSIKKSEVEDQFAVCKFIGHTGDQFIDDNIKQLINFHDEKTKAFSSLELA